MKGPDPRRGASARGATSVLDTMNAIVPWGELCAVIEPHYPKRGNGRPPIGLERM
ncbi:MAG: Mobile element protein, partial [uncultured Paraburkholderia sp.]